MKRDLISLGTLEAMGFKFSTHNGVLKVSQGNRVVLKAERINNLYYYICFFCIQHFKYQDLAYALGTYE
jgi:hypothetical protein